MSFGVFQFRRDTAANWTSANPTLASGEMGIETNTAKFKIGDGTTAWSSLAYGGIVGPTGLTGPTGQGFTGRGAWSSVTAYVIGDEVLASDGNGYIAISATTNVNPVTDGGVHWKIAVSVGATGGVGPTGPAGPAPPLGSATPTTETLGGTAVVGTATNASHEDHRHALTALDDTAHGSRGGGTLHANATTSVAGFMAAADKTALNAAVPNTRQITTTAPLAGGGDMSADRVFSIAAATQSAAGSQSAVDKAREDHWFNSAFYNVLDNGIAPGNTAAVNDAAWAALMSVVADNGTVFFPPGPTAYSFNSTATLSIPAGKHLKILGGGNQKSIIQTTHATVDIFTCGDWFQTFQGLKFISSVTRTAGAAINSGNNVSINVFDCDFSGMFNGINYSGGASAGNLAFVDNCGFTGTLNSGIIVNGTNANSIISRVTMDGTSGVQQSGIEVNQCGSLLIANTDLIRAQNNLNLNPGSGSNGIFSVYCSQVFMDTAATNGCIIQGSGTTNVQRVKFANCWFSSAGTHGLTIAGTATNLPTGITLVNCDVFSNGNSGIRLLGCRDVIVTNCNIAGNTTAGIQTTAGAGAVTKLNAQSNTIGPTGGIGANGTGVLLNAGAYGGISITGNDVSANTTANLTDNGATVPTPDMKTIGGNLGHLLKGALSSLGAPVAVPTTTETLILNARIPANAVAVGQVFRLKAVVITGGANVTTWRARVGAAGTVAGDTVVADIVVTAAGFLNGRSTYEGLITVRSLGAPGSLEGEGHAITNTAANASAAAQTTAAAAGTVAVTTTAAWFIDISVASPTSTATAVQAVIEAL